MDLWDYFEDPITGFGSIKSHLLILYSIAVGMDAKVIVEIGMRDGDSTRAFLWACQKTGGRLYSVDISEYPETIEEIERLNLSKYHEFIKGDSQKIHKQWSTPIDILFLDGCHYYGNHKMDFDNWYSKVREGGIILVHDVDPSMPHHDGWKHFENEVLFHYEACALMFGGGLGIVRKRK